MFSVPQTFSSGDSAVSGERRWCGLRHVRVL